MARDTSEPGHALAMASAINPVGRARVPALAQHQTRVRGRDLLRSVVRGSGSAVRGSRFGGPRFGGRSACQALGTAGLPAWISRACGKAV